MNKFIFALACSVGYCVTEVQPTMAQSVCTLQQLKDSARQNNIATCVARHDIETAREQRKEAFTKFFPNVRATSLTFNANKGTAKKTLHPSEMISPEMGAGLSQMLPAEALAALSNPVSISLLKNGTIAGVTATQPVFAGGQIINGNRLAKVGEDVALLQLRLSENEVEKTTEQYFWQLVSLQEKMKTVAAVDTMLRDIHKDVEVAVRAGVALHNDLLQVELRQNEVESKRLKLRNGISVVSLLLAQYCGLRDTCFVLSYDADAVFTPLQQDHQQALLATPEYQLLGKQVEATKLQKQIEIGKNLPTVAVGAGYNYHTLLNHGHSFAMLFATVSVPISDWWGGSHAIKRKKIAYLQAREQQADQAQLLTIRMQNAWNNVIEARQQLAIARRSIEQAEENLRLHRNFYHAGTCKMSDLLEAQLIYQQSRDSHTEAFADLQNKILEYRQSIGE